MKMLKHLPNALTCGNLLCGCLGIVFCLENRSVPIAYFVWTAGVFDFFDGFAAQKFACSWRAAADTISSEGALL